MNILPILKSNQIHFTCTIKSFVFFTTCFLLCIFIQNAYCLKTIITEVEQEDYPITDLKGCLNKLSDVISVLKELTKYPAITLSADSNTAYLTIKKILEESNHINASITSSQFCPANTDIIFTPDKKILRFIRKHLPEARTYYLEFKEALRSGSKTLDLKKPIENIINRVYLCNNDILSDTTKQPLREAKDITDSVYIHYPSVAKDSPSKTTKRMSMPYCHCERYLRGIIIEKFPGIFSVIFFENSGAGHYLGFTYDKKTYYNASFSSEYAHAICSGVYANKDLHNSLKLKLTTITSDEDILKYQEIINSYLLLDLKTIPAMPHFQFYYDAIDLPENIMDSAHSFEQESLQTTTSARETVSSFGTSSSGKDTHSSEEYSSIKNSATKQAISDIVNTSDAMVIKSSQINKLIIPAIFQEGTKITTNKMLPFKKTDPLVTHKSDFALTPRLDASFVVNKIFIMKSTSSHTVKKPCTGLPNSRQFLSIETNKGSDKKLTSDPIQNPQVTVPPSHPNTAITSNTTFPIQDTNNPKEKALSISSTPQSYIASIPAPSLPSANISVSIKKVVPPATDWKSNLSNLSITLLQLNEIMNLTDINDTKYKNTPYDFINSAVTKNPNINIVTESELYFRDYCKEKLSLPPSIDTQSLDVLRNLEPEIDTFLCIQENLLKKGLKPASFRDIGANEKIKPLLNRFYFCLDHILFTHPYRQPHNMESMEKHLVIQHPRIGDFYRQKDVKRIGIPYYYKSKCLRAILLEKKEGEFSSIIFDKSGFALYLGFTHDGKSYYNVKLSPEFSKAIINSIYLKEGQYKALHIETMEIDRDDISPEKEKLLKEWLTLDLKTLPTMCHLLIFSKDIKTSKVSPTSVSTIYSNPIHAKTIHTLFLPQTSKIKTYLIDPNFYERTEDLLRIFKNLFTHFKLGEYSTAPYLKFSESLHKDNCISEFTEILNLQHLETLKLPSEFSKNFETLYKRIREIIRFIQEDNSVLLRTVVNQLELCIIDYYDSVFLLYQH